MIPPTPNFALVPPTLPAFSPAFIKANALKPPQQTFPPNPPAPLLPYVSSFRLPGNRSIRSAMKERALGGYADELMKTFMAATRQTPGEPPKTEKQLTEIYEQMKLLLTATNALGSGLSSGLSPAALAQIALLASGAASSATAAASAAASANASAAASAGASAITSVTGTASSTGFHTPVTRPASPAVTRPPSPTSTMLAPTIVGGAPVFDYAKFGLDRAVFEDSTKKPSVKFLKDAAFRMNQAIHDGTAQPVNNKGGKGTILMGNTSVDEWVARIGEFMTVNSFATGFSTPAAGSSSTFASPATVVHISTPIPKPARPLSPVPFGLLTPGPPAPPGSPGPSGAKAGNGILLTTHSRLNGPAGKWLPLSGTVDINLPKLGQGILSITKKHKGRQIKISEFPNRNISAPFRDALVHLLRSKTLPDLSDLPADEREYVYKILTLDTPTEVLAAFTQKQKDRLKQMKADMKQQAKARATAGPTQKKWNRLKLLFGEVGAGNNGNESIIKEGTKLLNSLVKTGAITLEQAEGLARQLR